MLAAQNRAPISNKRRAAMVMRRQYDVITHDQLLGAGWSSSSISRAVAAGDLTCLYKGVYIDGAADVRPESRLLGACLAGARRGRASHRGAGWVWKMTERPFVEITRPYEASGSLPGCVVHRTLSMPRAVMRKKIPCTNPLRTMIDLASVIDGDDLWLAFARGVSSRLFTPKAVHAENDRLRTSGRRGSMAIDAILGELGPVSLESPSVLQLAFARLVVRHGLEWPEPEHPVGRFRLDYAYPDVQFGIELHGFDQHDGDPILAAEGHRRHRALTALGWDVPVFTWDDVWNHPDRTACEVRTRLARLRG